MASGLTYKIEQGITTTGREFILDCAGSFGGYIRFRDCDDIRHITKVEPDIAYYENKLKEAQIEVAKLKSLSPVVIKENIVHAAHKRKMKHEKRIQESEELKKKYYKVLEEVIAWEPPSEQHKSIKEFAIKQITDTMTTDLYDESRFNQAEYEADLVKDPEAWRQEWLEFWEGQVKLNEDRIKQELEYAETTTKWIQEFRQSLGLDN